MPIDRAMLQSQIHSALEGVTDAEVRATLIDRMYNAQGLTMTNLSTAQNVLLFELFEQTLFGELGPITQDQLRYPSTYYGSDALRRGLARFLEQAWGVEHIEYQDVFATAGVLSGLECLAFALLEPGPPGGPNGTVIVPAPCWQGFQYAFRQRAKMRFRPFDLQTRFELTLEDVQRAYRVQVEEDGRAPRILILNNPQNPLAINYPPSLLEEIYEWVLAETGMHIISDEIYTHCQVGGGGAEPQFKSALALDAVRRFPGPAADRVHVVYGLSKDFGLAGYKVGFVVSRSWPVRRALGAPSKVFHSMTSFCPFDAFKQYGVAPLFVSHGNPDPRLAARAVRTLSGSAADPDGCASLLEMRHRAVAEQLRAGGIEVVGEGLAGLFFWLDLRAYLHRLPLPSDNTPVYVDLDPAESTLNNQITEFGQVLLLPGGVLSCPEPGYFRLCYTGWDEPIVGAAVGRLIDALGSLRPA